MGKRLGGASGGAPKCLIRLAGESILERLLRQIRAGDPRAQVTVVAGYRAEKVAAAAAGCSVVVNPFFDVTGINASIWFARSCFDDDLLMIHGDLAVSDGAMAALQACRPASLIGYDSRILDPGEINVQAAEGRVLRFGVNYKGYSGAYAGIMGFCRNDAMLFGRLLDERVRRGFNNPGTYYFAFLRAMIRDHGAGFLPFDLAPYAWAEIDRAADIQRARDLFEGGPR